MDGIILFIAIFATVIFAVQFILTLIGFDYDIDIEIEFSSFEFNFLNLKTICMFLLMFGWTYTLCDDWSQPTRLLVGFIIGLASLITLGYIMKKVYSIEDEEVPFDYKSLEGTEHMLFTYYDGKGTVVIDGNEYAIVNDSGVTVKSGDIVLLKEYINFESFKI